MGGQPASASTPARRAVSRCRALIVIREDLLAFSFGYSFASEHSDPLTGAQLTRYPESFGPDRSADAVGHGCRNYTDYHAFEATAPPESTC